MDKQSSHSGPDLTGAHPREPASAADGPPDGARRLEAELGRLRAALEDVVALALTESDPRQRVIMMQRRAIAALTGLDARPAPGAPHT